MFSSMKKPMNGNGRTLLKELHWLRKISIKEIVPKLKRLQSNFVKIKRSVSAKICTQAMLFINHLILFCTEDELEEAESYLETRFEKRKEYFAKTLLIDEKRRRKWLCKQGKGHMLDFGDE